MTSAQRAILVVDDDMELCELLTDYLGQEELVVETASEASTGLARAGDHSMVVLDVMLPGMSGFELLRRLRERSQIPVLMLTARGDVVDRVVGLEMGADDYLAKPFDPRELVARIRAILRRGKHGLEMLHDAGQTDGPLILGDLELNPGTRVARRAGKVVPLTSVEFSLLLFLTSRAGRVVSREELSMEVMGRKLSAYDRSIDVHVSSLRKKLSNRVGDVERIKTVRGVGYQYSTVGTPSKARTKG